MKAVTLITSCNRNGNEKKLVDRLTIGIEDADGSNEVLFLDDYDIHYCTGCGACANGKGCIIDDDLNEIIEKVRQADYFIFAAPIFFGDLAGQSKVFLDRFASVGKNPEQEMQGKKCALMITHFTDSINEFVINNTHLELVAANLKVNKIMDVGDLLTKKFTEDELEDYEDIGYELEDYDIIPHKLDLDNLTV